jgi:response regulator RpfG family c-di-GMP phosphodiesterase
MLSGFQHPFLDLAATVARNHHERWNGTGYPDHFVGEASPTEARIVAIVDVYDALGQRRCYKAPWSREEIADYVSRERGVLFEARLVDALLEVIPELEAINDEHPDPEEALPAPSVTALANGEQHPGPHPSC